jgi:hypothetical protein
LVEVLLPDKGQDQIVEPETTKSRYLVIVKREDVDAVDLRADMASHRTDIEHVDGTAQHSPLPPWLLTPVSSSSPFQARPSVTVSPESTREFFLHLSHQ